MPGEDRAARLRQALAAYDEALDKLRDVPLAYATTQNNRAVLLTDLATLPGEDRAARLRQALADIASALHIFEQMQQAQYLQVGRRVLASLIVTMGGAEFRTAWLALTDHPIPSLPADLLLSALVEQSGITSQEEFLTRLQSDLVFRQQVEELAPFAQDESPAWDAVQPLADRLIAWIQTPDWGASEEYLHRHAAELLTDEAEAVLEGLRQANPESNALPQHQLLLRRCRQVGIQAAYREFHQGAALAALLAVDSLEGLEQALAQHPLLLELATLERLGEWVTTAAAAQPEVAWPLLARLGLLLERYNRAHTEGVDPAEQARFVALHQALLPAAEALDADLFAGLRNSLVWALNTLGNAHAGQGDHAAAIAAYSQAIGHAPQEAMLYRNRAGEYLEMRQWAQAEADIAQAAALEPDAPRLAHLRQTLAQQSEER